MASQTTAVGAVGRDWTTRNPIPTGEDILAVVGTDQSSAAPQVVAVGKHGIIFSSGNDGVDWTQHTATTLSGAVVTSDLRSVIWTGSQYVVVGAGSTVLTSTDGNTWTHHLALGNDDLRAIVLVGSRYIAVGGTGTVGAVQSSTNLNTWVRGTPGVAEPIIDIAGLDGTTPTITAITAKTLLKGTVNLTTGAVTFAKLTGFTGITATDLPQSITITPVSGTFVLSTSTALLAPAKIWTSSNSLAWTAATLTGITNASSRLFVNANQSDLIATGPAGDFWTSPDAVTWTQLASGQPEIFFNGAKSSTRYIACGERGRIFIIYNVASFTWESRLGAGPSTSITGVGTNGTAFVAAGDAFTLTSGDGLAWTNHAQTGKTIRSVAHTGSQYLLVGNGAWKSPDGVTLTDVIPAVTGESLRRVIWTGTQAVAVGAQTGATPRSLIYYSPDGNTWTKPTLPTTATLPLNGVAASSGLIVAVGDGGTVVASVDFGVTWTKRAVALTAGESFTDVVFASGQFMACTSKGGVWTSPNGVVWTKRKASSAAGLQRIVSAGNQTMGFGDGGIDVWSFGGTEWTESLSGTSQNLADAAWNGTRLVAVGANGIIISSDGAAASRPTVDFAAGTSIPGEASGSQAITLTLTPAATLPVTVTYSIGGTATMSASGDYTIPTVPVTFAAGETSKTITATIKSDAIDEIAETAIITLGTPTGDAALGVTSVHTMTILDDDTLPAITTQPQSQLVNVGANVTFTAGASGAPTPTAQWKKNGATVAALGTTIGNAPINSVKLTDAAAYTVLATNPAGTALSNAAQLGVVDNTLKNLSVAADATVVLTCNAAGNGLLYQWQKGGVDLPNSTSLRISGATSKTLTLKNVNLGDAATYACRVSMGALTATGGTTVLDVRIFLPAGPTANPVIPSPGGTGPGSSWTLRNPLPSGEDVLAMVGDAQTSNPAPAVVAVGAHGLILSSADHGVTWTKRTATDSTGTSPRTVTEDLNDIIWDPTSPGRFVAVGSKSAVLTSLDGSTWTYAKALDSDDLMSVVRIGTRFLVVGGNATVGTAQTSSDLASWVKGSTGVAEHLTRVVSTSGGSSILAITPTFLLSGSVAVGTGVVTFSKITSLTGLTANNLPNSLTLAGSTFVLATRTASGGAGDLWTATVSSTWTKRTPIGFASESFYVRWSGNSSAGSGELIGTGDHGDVWTSSSNGTSWAQKATGELETLFIGTKTATVGTPSYIVGGQGGRIFSLPVTGSSTWTSRYSTGPTTNIEGVASDGAGFLAVGEEATLTSTTGATWTSIAQLGKTLRSVVRSGSEYVIVGRGAFTTTDGLTLTQRISPSSSELLNRVALIGTNHVAVGLETGTPNKSLIYSSADGHGWSKNTVPAAATQALHGVAGAADTYVAVGDLGTVLRSVNQGNVWTKLAVALAAGENFTDVVYAANLFITTTSKGAIWTSPNGLVWTKRKVSSAGGFQRIILAGNLLHAVGIGGTTAYSFGGIDWAESNAGTSSDLTDEGWNGTRLVAVGPSGSVVSSDAASVSRSVLSFSTASSSASESVGGGSVNVQVGLTPASTQAVSVLYGLSGTATFGASGDYTAPVAALVFAPGETSKNIVITVKPDVVDELDETVVLTLNTPTGDAELGTTKVHTLTITDDDAVPGFSVQPVNQLVTLGTNVSLVATATGSPVPTAQWKKNGATQAALGTTFSTSLNLIKLADAGAWSVLATNTAGTKLSDIVQIGVVDNTLRSVTQVGDSTVTLTCSAAGNGLAYQWLKGGVPMMNTPDTRITGATTSKLVIKNATFNDTAQYTCRVGQGALSTIGATTDVSIVLSTPLILTSVLPATGIAQLYDFVPSATAAPNNWTMLNPPSGLAINASTGRITGRATASGDFTSIILTARNIVGASPPKTVTLHVDPLPSIAAGKTFYALIDRDNAVNIGLGAYLDITTTATGSFSGTLREGAIATAVIGSLTHNVGAGTSTAAVALTPVVPSSPAGLPVPPPVTLNFSMNMTTGIVTGSLVSGASSATFTATRKDLWSVGAPAAEQGRFNFIINPPVVSTPATEITLPLGFGFGSLTIAADGTYTAVGKTSDQKVWSTTGVLTASEQVPVYAGAYNSLGSLHGLLDLTLSSSQVYTPPDTNVGDCNLTDTSTTVACGTAALLSGQTISGVGIPALTTISSVTDATHFVLSAAATETGTFSFGSAGMCSVTAGSANVTCLGTAVLSVGMNVTGTGVPANTTVASITDASHFELSAQATQTGAFRITGFLGTLLANCATTASSSAVTCNDTSLLRTGMHVTGTGIPSNATVASVSDRTHFTLNANATQTTSAATCPAFPVLPKEVRASGDLTWMRRPETATVTAAELQRERNYRKGFTLGAINTATGFRDTILVKADGGRYHGPAVRATSPTLTGVLMNRPTTNNNAHIVFNYALLPTTRTTPPENDNAHDPDSVLTLDIPDDAHLNGVFNISNPNTNFTVDPDTGLFSGDFDRDDLNPTNTALTVHRLNNAYFGIVIRQFSAAANGNDKGTGSSVSQLGYGFFTLPDLPRAGQGVGLSDPSDLNNSPLYSGEVRLGP